MKRLIVLFLFCSWQSSHGQLLTDSIYPGEVLMADLDTLAAVVMRTHTEPFRYSNWHEWNNSLFYAKQQSMAGLNKVEFAKVVAEFLATLKDSHTYLNFGSLSSSVPSDDFYDLGLTLHRDSAGIFISEDRFGICRPGDYLKSINGRDVDSAWTEASCLAMQEGNAATARLEVATVLFRNFLPLIIPIEPNNQLVVERQGEILELSHAAITRTEMRKERRKTAPPLYEYYLTEEPNIAVIRIASFGAGSGRKYRQFVNRAFRKAEKQGIQHLIIDIRKNGGGKSSRMEYLARHVLRDSIAVPHSIVYRQSEIGKNVLGRNDRWWRRPFMKLAAWRNTAVRNYLEMFEIPEGETDTLVYPVSAPFKKHHFDGHCYLLTNGLSGSASANLASIFRHTERGVIAGSPPLGPLSGTWGNPGPYRLPESGLDVMISTIRFNTLNGVNSGDAIVPEILVYPTALDAANLRDPVLDAVIRSIEY